MAQKIQTLLIDDLDGGEADETLTFAFEGVQYEIDLASKNADKMRKVLGAYVAAGRRVGGRISKGKPASKSNGGNPDTAKIREWAMKSGYEINGRGRIPATVVGAYEKAHG